MPTYTVHEAKTHLSKLIERAERGEEVIIARKDKPVVRLQPLAQEAKPKRQPGMLKGILPEIPDSAFFDRLPEDELKLWEEGYEGDPLNAPGAGKPHGASS
jgi:prevent-host-death family protein